MVVPRFLRTPLARFLRSLPVRGRWRIAAPFQRLAPAERTTIQLPGVGAVTLDLGVAMQRQIYWAGLGHDDVRIARTICAALPQGGVFLDVGANIGIHTLAAARHLSAGGGTVLAFEPHPANYRGLLTNIQGNGLRHVSAENLGLSDAPAFLTGTASADGGNWSLASQGDYQFEVRLVRLDDYLSDQPLPRLDVMKIDVEGAEVRVLRGARETIQRFRPLIVFEVCPGWLRRMETCPEELFAELHAQGYTIHPLPGRDLAWRPRLHVTDLAGMRAGAFVNLVGVPLAVPSPQPPWPRRAKTR